MSEKDWKSDVEIIFAFHVKRAPGLPIGACMVDLAREKLGKNYNNLCAICETSACLPDAIQVMTGCTIGNGHLKILEKIGRYAFTLYDRDTGDGIRVAVDIKKIDPEKTPELYKFFHRTRGEKVQQPGPERKASNAKVMEEFYTVGREILSWQKVKVKDTSKPPLLPAKICQKCGESFLSSGEEICLPCSGDSYYTVVA